MSYIQCTKRGEEMKRWFWITVTCVFCAAFLGAALNETIVFTDGESAAQRPRIVIDAGHGGFDGGAKAPDGTEEKTLNLEIAQALSAMLTVCGFEVTMTRRTDDGLEDADDTTIRQKKVSDMYARLALYEEAQLVISIHQNMFAAKSCRGSQVFYSPNHPCSKVLASCVREQLLSQLQPENTRELKAGNKDIFLLHKTMKPTVLVECGFLSNAEELARLKDEGYQRQLAFAIACGAVDFMAQKGEIV